MKNQAKKAAPRRQAGKTVAPEETRQPTVPPTTPICVSDRIPVPSGSLPPLPDDLMSEELQFSPEDNPAFPGPGAVVANPIPVLRFRSLRQGCYLLRYTPTQLNLPQTTLHYDGTLRVERNGVSTTASGDLYRHLVRILPWPFPRPSELSPAAGIPIFPRSEYRYYVRVTRSVSRRPTTPRSSTPSRSRTRC
jgi:hypothetical protein